MFYSHTLKDTQMQCTTTELLSVVVKTLKDFRTILPGHKILVFNSHNNLMYDDLCKEQVLQCGGSTNGDVQYHT